ncbi:MAG: alpha/beta fold hydrolase [Hyphomicrobiaceae bacterium]
MPSVFHSRICALSRFAAVVGALLAGIAAPLATAAHGATSYRATVTPSGAPPIDLYVEEHGPAGAPPVLLLHGLAASTHSWRHVVPMLAPTNRVIALDLRGFGRSDKPFDQRYSAADQAAHVTSFIERRGLKGITLVGHSFGGAVALVTTLGLNARRPGLIRRLVLLDVPAYPQEPTAFVSFLRKPVLPYALLTLVPPELAAALVLSPENEAGSLDLTDVRTYAAPFYEAAARHALISTARQLRPSNWRQIVARYPTIRQPTLIVWCDGDNVVPLSSGARLVKALPNARLEVIRGCVHSPQDEKPAALIRLMRAFVER